MLAPNNTAPAIYAALDSVRQAINKLGIAKAREVTDGVRFKFRGIDDVMDTFSGPMAEARLQVFPAYSGLVVEERKTKSGSANYNVKVAGSLRFVSLVDGSSEVAGPFYGEANDTADKATAKAMSIAFRQGFLLTFIVPLGPDMDTEITPEALQVEDRKERHDFAVMEYGDAVAAVKDAIAAEDWARMARHWNTIPESYQRDLWLATTKGGTFSTAERKAIKEKQPRAVTA